MSAGLAYNKYDKGGLCYAACQEAFEWWNASTFWCQKGCDFSRGRASDPLLRDEAENMCKMMAASSYSLQEHEDLDHVEDKRIHATMYPVNATNLYKACLAGVRRQRY